MFFTPELLSRRDSGIGLLWLAATLGSKSTFKKLQKRDVMTANISQLCTLVAQPTEPLALRLSSNLMVGVARVYKVKQEIFMSDVTVCFNALKKVVEELRYNGDLQMAQPNARASALTLANDLKTAFGMEYDNMIADWDNYLDVAENNRSQSIDDDDFDQKVKPKKTKQKTQPLITAPEEARADLYLLKENHEYLFSSSFDASFHGSGGPDLSSSQHEAAFEFRDDFLGELEDLDIGADLARELGEGWGGSPVKPPQEAMMDLEQPFGIKEDGFGVGTNADVDPVFGFGADYPGRDDVHLDLGVDVAMEIHEARSDNGCMIPESPQLDQDNNSRPSPSGVMNAARDALSPASFVRSFLAQDMDQEPDAVEPEMGTTKPTTRKPKTARLLLDARTEMTDAEIKASRAQYLDLQSRLRNHLALKRSGKGSEQVMEDLLWSVPSGVYAQALVDFWLHNFKIQVEARSGAVNIHPPAIDDDDDEPARKRRKVNADKLQNGNGTVDHVIMEPALNANHHSDYIGLDAGTELGGDFVEGGYNDIDEQETAHLRSSEEPGQGRRVSRPPSVLGSNFGSQIGIQDVPSGSQRSSLFPWDNAGASSSAGGAASGVGVPEGDRISVERGGIRVRGRGSSLSRRESSSQAGSATGIGFSPIAFGKMSGEDFAFDIPVDEQPNIGQSQQSGLNLVTLERNSFNFLELVSLLLVQNCPHDSSTLTFDDIVPKTTSTRRVASVAFYHCLVLATKDLLRLKQTEAYGPFSINIV